MKVIMLTSVSTTHTCFKEKQLYDVSPQKAKKWVNRGLAKLAEEEKDGRLTARKKPRTTSLPKAS